MVNRPRGTIECRAGCGEKDPTKFRAHPTSATGLEYICARCKDVQRARRRAKTCIVEIRGLDLVVDGVVIARSTHGKPHRWDVNLYDLGQATGTRVRKQRRRIDPTNPDTRPRDAIGR